MNQQRPDDFNAVEQRFAVWLHRHHTAEMIERAEAQALWQDMVTLLTYVRDNKVVGTQSTGNMPRKAVREVTARFVNPPKLDRTIGDHTHKLRSEADVWPLYFLHILAEVGDLVKIVPGRRWRLLPEGERFLTLDPFLQLGNLSMIWWYKVNWLVAYPYEGMGEELPDYFNLATLDRLLALPVGEQIPFEEFADDLIARTGLTWTSSQYAEMLLRSSIERMVIYILRGFGVVKNYHRKKSVGESAYKELVAFEITPLGRALLEGLTVVQR
jgi:hypothetical protein